MGDKEHFNDFPLPRVRSFYMYAITKCLQDISEFHKRYLMSNFIQIQKKYPFQKRIWLARDFSVELTHFVLE